jgi:hypothetical protein
VQWFPLTSLQANVEVTITFNAEYPNPKEMQREEPVSQQAETSPKAISSVSIVI